MLLKENESLFFELVTRKSIHKLPEIYQPWRERVFDVRKKSHLPAMYVYCHAWELRDNEGLSHDVIRPLSQSFVANIKNQFIKLDWKAWKIPCYNLTPISFFLIPNICYIIFYNVFFYSFVQFRRKCHLTDFFTILLRQCLLKSAVRNDSCSVALLWFSLLLYRTSVLLLALH